jgi:hypothetical protein
VNEFSAYPQPVPGGYRVMLRFAKDGKPKPLMCAEDRPHIFPTEGQAWAACTHHLLAYMNGHFRRDGAVIEAKSKADALFNLKPIRTKGRVIAVERRRMPA